MTENSAICSILLHFRPTVVCLEYFHLIRYHALCYTSGLAYCPHFVPQFEHCGEENTQSTATTSPNDEWSAETNYKPEGDKYFKETAAAHIESSVLHIAFFFCQTMIYIVYVHSLHVSAINTDLWCRGSSLNWTRTQLWRVIRDNRKLQVNRYFYVSGLYCLQFCKYIASSHVCLCKSFLRQPVLKFCYHCGRSTFVKWIACDHCYKVSYCSVTCKSKGWEERHMKECKQVSGETQDLYSLHIQPGKTK